MPGFPYFQLLHTSFLNFLKTPLPGGYKPVHAPTARSAAAEILLQFLKDVDILYLIVSEKFFLPGFFIQGVREAFHSAASKDAGINSV